MPANKQLYGYKVLHVDPLTQKMTTLYSNEPGVSDSEIFFDVAAVTQDETSVKLFTVQAKCPDVINSGCTVGKL